MSLVWAVPVVAVLAATLVVVARSRAIEREVVGLAIEVARLGELRPHLVNVRRSLHAVDAEVERLRARRERASP